MNGYPPAVQDWIKRKGGTVHVIPTAYLPDREAATQGALAPVPGAAPGLAGRGSCATPPQRAAASHDIGRRLLRRRSGSTRHDRCLDYSPQKPLVSDAAHRPAAIPLALSHLIPGSQQAPSTASTPFLRVQQPPVGFPDRGPAYFGLPDPPPPRCPPPLNPHRARCTVGAPLPAISCLGASRTPPVGARA